MRYKGPIITLLAGLAVAAVLMVLNLGATARDQDGGAANAGSTVTVSPPVATTPATAPTTPATPPTEQVTYAGRVAGAAATIAIAIKNGTAVAYLCDGRSTEAWLQGSAVNGQLALAGAGNARLSGSYAGGVANGTVSAAGRQWAFSVHTVKPPSGLYRATANVRNAQVVGGWIVLADGTQVGLLRVGEQTQPAPVLDLADRVVTVDGSQIVAAQVDGTAL